MFIGIVILGEQKNHPDPCRVQPEEDLEQQHPPSASLRNVSDSACFSMTMDFFAGGGILSAVRRVLMVNMAANMAWWPSG